MEEKAAEKSKKILSTGQKQDSKSKKPAESGEEDCDQQFSFHQSKGNEDENDEGQSSKEEDNKDSLSSVSGDDSQSLDEKDDNSDGLADINKQGNAAIDLLNVGFNLGNYTSEDMASLTQITQEMNRRMDMARGMKRGRKVQGFADYCQKTTARIN